MLIQILNVKKIIFMSSGNAPSNKELNFDFLLSLMLKNQAFDIY